MILNQKILLLTLSIFCFSELSSQGNSKIEQIFEQITIDSYKGHFDSLRTNPNCSRKVVKAQNQHKDHDACRDYIARCLTDYLGSVNVCLHHFHSSEYKGLCNIVGFKRGTSPSEGIWVISAHYDTNNNFDPSLNDSTPAPGANDNGTGLAALLEIARVISKYETRASVIFAAWDMEERFTKGMGTGSNTWYNDFVSTKTDTEWDELPQGRINKSDIVGNINFDMFGNPQAIKDKKPVLWACYAKKRDLPFVTKYVNTINRYTSDIIAKSYGPLIWSDHYTFSSRNIPAVENLESNYSNDPFYHKALDNIKNPDNIDFNFTLLVTQGGFAYLLEQVIDFEIDKPFPLRQYPDVICETANYYKLQPNATITNSYGTRVKTTDNNYTPSKNGIYFIQKITNNTITKGTYIFRKKEGLF